MKKAIFFDRDGTLIVEPPETFQIDSLEQLEFLPGAIRNLYALQNSTDYQFIMVSNQDGLGTESYPLTAFGKVQDKMMKTLTNEGISFHNIHIDSSTPEEHRQTRKPGTGMLGEYFTPEWDLSASWVIGDRITDIELARNLGAKGILFMNPESGKKSLPEELIPSCALVSNDWDAISAFLRRQHQFGKLIRNTSETRISLGLSVNGTGLFNISTGLGFFDHMLEQISRHGQFDLQVNTLGDLHVDEHHTIEDTGIALGECFRQAMGKKLGIGRYGFVLPMDESAAMVLIDLSGRPAFHWEVNFLREKVGDVPTEMIKHFFKAFSDAARCTLHVKCYGENEHHKIEAIFKAFARALRQAAELKTFSYDLPSTKGML